jgi:hypothetical protein
MKKTIFTILVLSIVCFSISESQLIRDYGLKIGLASTNQNWNWSPEISQTGIVFTSTKAHQNIDIAGFIEWLNIPFFSLLTEVHFIRKGSDATTNIVVTTIASPDGNGQFLSYSTKINYLSVPILAKLRMSGPLLTPYIIAGPRFDYYLSGSGDNLLNDFKKIDIGGTFGVGVESASNLPIQMGLEFRYSPDFQDCFSSSGSGIAIKNRSMEFLLVLCF